MEERSIEEIQQYLLEVFNDRIDIIEINLCDEIFEWNKKDNISFQQFMLNEKENFKNWIAQAKEWWEKEVGEYTEGCLGEASFNINKETFTDYYKVEDIEELISVDNELYIKHIEFWMKGTAVSYLNDCCRDHTYQYDDIVMD